MESYKFPYLSAAQSQTQPPTEWEAALAATIEEAFIRGAKGLDEVVAALNASRVKPLAGGQWTAENYTTVMQQLGA